MFSEYSSPTTTRFTMPNGYFDFVCYVLLIKCTVVLQFIRRSQTIVSLALYGCQPLRTVWNDTFSFAAALSIQYSIRHSTRHFIRHPSVSPCVSTGYYPATSVRLHHCAILITTSN